jgi:hypothetical protein
MTWSLPSGPLPHRESHHDVPLNRPGSRHVVHVENHSYASGRVETVCRRCGDRMEMYLPSSLGHRRVRAGDRRREDHERETLRRAGGRLTLAAQHQWCVIPLVVTGNPPESAPRGVTQGRNIAQDTSGQGHRLSGRAQGSLPRPPHIWPTRTPTPLIRTSLIAADADVPSAVSSAPICRPPPRTMPGNRVRRTADNTRAR